MQKPDKNTSFDSHRLLMAQHYDKGLNTDVAQTGTQGRLDPADQMNILYCGSSGRLCILLKVAIAKTPVSVSER